MLKIKILFLFSLVLSFGLALVNPVFPAQVKYIQSRVVNLSDTDLEKSAPLSKPVDIHNSFIIQSQEGGCFASSFKDAKTLEIFQGFGGKFAVSREGSVGNYIVECKEGVKIFRGVAAIAPDVYAKDILLPQTINIQNAFVLISVRGNISKDEDAQTQFFKATFPDSNTLRLERADVPSASISYFLSTQYISWQVVELDGSAIVKSGSTSLPYDASRVTVDLSGDPITDISKAFLIFNYTGESGIKGLAGLLMTRGTITNANTLTFNRQAIGSTANQSIDIAWYVVELADLASNVQKGTFTIPPGSQSADLSLLQSVDTRRSFALISTSGGETNTAGLSDNLVRAQMLEKDYLANSLRLTRMASAVATDVDWFVIELAPLILQSPKGNEIWRVGETRNILWSHADSLEEAGSGFEGHHVLNILLSNDAGNTFAFTIAEKVDVTSDFYAWTIPDSIGGNNLISDKLRIRLIDTNLSQHNYDENDNNLQIKGSIDLAAPIGAEIWYVDDADREIIWHKQGDLSFSTFSIRLSEDGGITYDTVVADGLTQERVCKKNRCSWRWHPGVPDKIGSDRRIKVFLASDPDNVYDTSDTDFDIKGKLQIVSPNGREEWETKTNQVISWKKWGGFEYVSLHYSINSGDTYDYVIATAVPAGDMQGQYEWSVPYGLITDSARVKVVSEQPLQIRVEDVSDADFRIVPSLLEVTYPNQAGDFWFVGESHKISWKVHGKIERVHCWYSKQGQDPVRITPLGGVVADQENGIGWFIWESIPDNATGQEVSIIVAGVDGNKVPGRPFDYSDNPISIKGRLKLVSPNGTEVYTVGSSKTIKWDTQGQMGNLRILFAENGSDFNTIITPEPEGVAASTRKFIWDSIPDMLTSRGKIRIELILDPVNVYDQSDDYFIIKGFLDLTEPEPGQTFYIGDSVDIVWKTVGSLGNIELRYSLDGGETYPDDQIIARNIPQETAYFIWKIPDKISNRVRIKVSAIGEEAIFDESEADLAIKGSLSILSPADAEIWQAGTRQEIRWKRLGKDMGNLRLEYSTDDGADGYPNLIATDIPSGNLAYTWQVPGVLGSQLKIKITSLADEETYATSNGVFTIKGRFVLLAPVGNGTWYVGKQENISWVTYGQIDKVNLRYSIDAGRTYPGVIARGISNVDGYVWSVADAIGTKLRVKVENYYDSSVYATSENNFTIKGRVEVTSPNAGQLWRVGENRNITWIPYGSIGDVEIGYSTDAGKTYRKTGVISPLTGVDAALGIYTCIVPDAIGKRLKVRITSLEDSSVSDESEGLFEIKGTLTLTAPDGGQTLYVAESSNITWIKTGTLADVELRYSTDSGSTYPEENFIVKGIAASAGTYSWIIPDAITDRLRIKIKASDDPDNVYDQSDGDCAIRGKLRLVTPNGAESWGVGTTEDIAWKRTGSIQSLKIEYSTNSGATFPNLIVASADCSAGSYAWDIPDAIGSNIRVKITDIANADVSDTSDNDFQIKGSLTLTSPAGGESWVVGEERNISWLRTGSIANVKLEYSTDGFVDESKTSVITFSTPAAKLNYDWVIPDEIGNNLKIRIQDAADASVANSSNNSFSIKGALRLNSPNGKETWVVGQTNKITWERTGSIAKVKLEYSTDAGITYAAISSSTDASTGSYGWMVPDAIGNQLKIKISDASDSSVFDVSDNNFEIKGSLNLVSPNGEEAWVVGSAYDIAWSKTGTMPDVRLEYSTNAFDNELKTVVIAAAVDARGQPAGSYKYTWKIPDAISSRLRVRIVSNADPAVIDISDRDFKITGSFLLAQPNGKEKWTVGESYGINWKMSGSITNAKIDYSTDGGGSYPNLITASTPAAGLSYVWQIPDEIGSQLRVRISDAADAAVYDTSDNNFSIIAGFKIIQPNGGEVWAVDTVQEIAWRTRGLVDNVRLEYSTNAFVDESKTVVISDSAPNKGSYSWPVPPDISTDAKIRVSNALDADAYDISDRGFKIKGTLTLTSPNGAERWAVGSSSYITWSRMGDISTVKLEYSTDAGMTYPNIIIPSTDASAGTFSWVIPDKIGERLRIKISDSTDPTIYDASDQSFEITGALRLISPNGGEYWGVGSKQNITWERNGSIAYVRLDYSTDAGTSFSGLVTYSVPAEALRFAWTVPDAISRDVRVKISDISDSAVYDISDDNFTIQARFDIISPDRGEVWTVGSAHEIIWETVGSIDKVKLDYSTDGGLNFPYNIASAITDSGSFFWNIPDTISSQVRVRVSDYDNPAAFAISEADFKIRGSINLISPDGGEAWMIETEHDITWLTLGSIVNVKLEYSTDAGLTFPHTIVPAITAGLGSYSWIVPDAISNACRVRICDLSDSTVYDVSDNNFKIRGDLTLTSPNGKEEWSVGDVQSITWKRRGSIRKVRIEYSTDAGGTFPYLITDSADAATKFFNWEVDDAISSKVRVRVSDAFDATVYDISDSNFSIKGVLSLSSPDGGEVWKVGSTENISWSIKGSIADIKLEYSIDTGLTYPYVISAYVKAASESYAWLIPDNISSQARVKITNLSDETVYDSCDDDFKIVGKLALLSPNGGEVWSVGSVQTISWTRIGSIDKLRLEYSTDAGLSYPHIIATSLPADSGFYNWVVPDTISSQLRVKITDSTDSIVYDTSDNNFKIRGAIALISPNGGENWLTNSRQEIAWLYSGSMAGVKLEYSVDAGESYSCLIADSIDASVKSYSWLIPDNPSQQAKVRVSDLNDITVYDISDNNFSIQTPPDLEISSPNGNESWAAASQHDIVWKWKGIIPLVNLEYSSDGGRSYSLIEDKVANKGRYSWQLPERVGVKMRVKVSHSGDPAVFDASDADFRIRCVFVLTNPNGGQQWRVGKSYDITWTNTGKIPLVKLQYSRDGFLSDINTISTATPIDKPYYWNIPDTISDTVRVRVSDPGDPDAYDDSDEDFRITAYLEVTSPNGGESWQVGETRNITWDWQGTIAQVKIEYTIDGANYYLIGLPENTGSFSWQVPDTASNLFKVKISDLADYSVEDISDDYARIRGE